jgi:hypothetical protein
MPYGLQLARIFVFMKHEHEKISLALGSFLIASASFGQTVATCGTMSSGSLVVAPCVDYLFMCPAGYSLVHKWDGYSTFVPACVLTSSLVSH